MKSPSISTIIFRSSYIAILITGMVFLFSACKKDTQNTVDPGTKSISELNVSPTFNWATTHNVDFSISAKDNTDNAIPGVRFTVYTANPDSGGVYIASGFTGQDGIFKSNAVLPTTMTKVTIFNNFLGLVRQLEFPVTGNSVTGQFGGKTAAPSNQKSGGGDELDSPNAVKWVYMSSFNSQGVPNNLMPVNDPVSQTLLQDINNTLPEYKNEWAAHPEYFAPNVPKNLDITALSDVWITYITEGAGWMNSLAFFTFNTAQPPASSAQIDTIHVIFPNMSNSGSGGGLNPGNKIHLGVFPAGKSIGWVVVPHGWNGSATSVVSDVWYSIPSFNTTDPTMQQHMFMFKDNSRQQILFAFEDQGAYQGADRDFNDGVAYLTVNPITSANTTNMPLVATSIVDQDLDGVPDNSDDYPTDPTKAFNNYTPSKSGYSSLAYEDLWPGKGDYDFNDMVITYRFNEITNAQNQVVEIDATLIPEAIGASYHSAFAFQLPFGPEKVQTVTGQTLNHGYISISTNKTEAGQSKAVIVAFDDAYDHLPATGQGQTGANTTTGVPYVTPDTLHLVIKLAAPLTMAQAGVAPFNPFIIVNRNRNREVHLPDQPPTDLVDGTEFGTANDDSKPAQGRYYKTSNNLPWALNITEKFNYPTEKSAINLGYNKFNSWVETSGSEYANWYKNLSGYRTASKIYQH